MNGWEEPLTLLLPFPGGTPGPILVVGAGYYGEDVVDALLAAAGATDPPTIRGVIRTGEENKPVGDQLAGFPVIDILSNVDRYGGQVAAAVIAAPAGSLRERAATRLQQAAIPLLSVIHPKATVSSSAVIAAGVVVLAAAVVGAGTRLGVSTWIGSGAIVGSQCRVGDFSQVASTSALGNGVRVGQRAHIGMGTKVLDDVLIGADVEVPAGSLVNEDRILGEQPHERDPV